MPSLIADMQIITHADIHREEDIQLRNVAPTDRAAEIVCAQAYSIWQHVLEATSVLIGFQ